MSNNVVKNTDHDTPEPRPNARCLEGHTNQQAPILKLSGDVLLIIFMMVRDWNWISRSTVARITHVCQDWRYIAIGAPLLWTRTLFSSCPDWTILALQRARTAPIEVEIDFVDTNGMSEVSRALLGHITHTSKLVMIGSGDHLDEAQKLIAEDDTTQLEELSIWCIDNRTVENPRSFVLSSTTFYHTPKLRRLTLHRVDIDFNSPLLRNLTTLRLQRISDTAVPTWAKLLEALTAMPLLQHLQLEDVFPQTDASVLATLVIPVDLGSLQTLSVTCSTASQIYIALALVHFPPLSSLNLQWLFDDLPGQDQTTIFSSIAESVYARRFGPKIDTLEVEQTPLSGRIAIKLGPHIFGGPGLSLWFPQEIANLRFLENFLDLFFLSNITVFELKIYHEYGHLDLRGLTSKMPHLEFVTVGNNSNTAFNFIEILDVGPPSFQSESPAQVCLPRLEHITWAGGDFSEREVWVDEVAVGVLSRRRERGLGIKTLEFIDVNNLSPKLVGLFEKGVTKVLIRDLSSE